MLQQRNRIIAELYNSKDFNECINKMEPEHLRADLRNEVMLVLCEKDPMLIIGLEQRSELRWYVVRVILNMVKSNSSPFVKQYRTRIEDISLHHKYLYREHEDVEQETILNIVDPPLNGRVHREFTEQAVLRFINTELYWYDRTIVNMYMKFGNYRAIQTETKIPWESCYKTVRRVVDKVRKEVLNAPE